MEKVHRSGADLAGIFRQMGDMPDVAGQGEPVIEAVPVAPERSRRSLIMRLLKAILRRVWYVARPFARGPAHRLRQFMTESLRQDIQVAREALRQDVVNTQTWAHGESQAMAATLARDLLIVREAVTRESRVVHAMLSDSTRHALDKEARIDALEQRLSLIQTHVDDTAIKLDTAMVQMARVEAYALKTMQREAIPVARGRIMIRSAVGYMVLSDEDTALLAQMIDQGELEPGVRRLIERLVKPGMTFVDIGANIGMHTVVAGKIMQGRGRIVAFEPLPATAAMLNENIWNNGLSGLCEVHVSALADSSGERTLFLGKTSGHHSLFPLEEADSGKDHVAVRVETLDEVLSAETHVDLIKIDAEGAELEIIRGASEILRSNPQILMIVEFGASHLQRVGRSVAEWLHVFSALGFDWQAIDDVSGELFHLSEDELMDRGAVNLLFARPTAN